MSIVIACLVEMLETATVFDRQSLSKKFHRSTLVCGVSVGILLAAFFSYGQTLQDAATGLLLIVLLLATLGTYLANRHIKRLTRQLAEKEATIHELRQERDRATRMLQSKTHTLAIACHEFKTPINVIQGFSELCIELVKEQCQPELAKELITDLRLINESASTLTLQAQQILLSEELEWHGLGKRVDSVSLKKLVSDRIRKLEVSAEKKAITLTVNINGAYPVLANSIALGQAVDNLLSNAIKFSPPHTTVRISLSPCQNDQYVRLSIRDEGPGLHASEIEKLFKPFSRLSARPTSGESSSGLGLSIVKQIIDGHGGKVWCESKYGQGANFLVELKLQK